MGERDSIRILHWGLDPVGLVAARLVWGRPGMMPVGGVDRDPSLTGRDLGEAVGFGERYGVSIHGEPEAVLAMSRPDITLISGPDRVDEAAPMILKAIEAGSNVVCLSAEMVYPWAVRPDLAESLDELAHAHGVTVLGTGLNPGFLLDTLVVALTGCCLGVERIRASRVSDLTPFGAAVFQEEGIGLSPSRFGERRPAGPTAGFEPSIHLIADALGWQLERVKQERQPILARVRRQTPHGQVEPGQVAGVVERAAGYVGGIPRILLEQPRQVSPELEGMESGDYIEIEGEPSIKLAIQPSVDGVRGAAAIAVNMMPMVLQAGPGLKTMADLPIPRAVLGDIREMLPMAGPTVEEGLASGWHQPDLAGEPRKGPHGSIASS